MAKLDDLTRRTMLRGTGVTMALPLLEAMGPRSALAASAGAKAPTRAAFLYVPNGIHMPDWTPAAEGPLGELPKTLAALDPVKQKLMVLSGLAHDKARANGDGAGDHARSVGTFLTGQQIRKTAGKDIKAGVSIDQVAAERIGDRTPLRSLEIGCERGSQAGNCDSGYSCAYSSNMSWRTPNTPMPKEINPRSVFERLFGSAAEVASKQKAAEQARHRASVLDLVREDARALQSELGAADRGKLDQYLESVREVERRVQYHERDPRDRLPTRVKTPPGIPAEYAEHVALMLDLMVLALQTDSTRIVTFMYANAGSNRPYPFLGVREGHHSLSHHRGDETKQQQIARINRFHVEQLSRTLQRMDGIAEGDGSLLDHTMLLYGCAISDGNRHNHDNLPILLAGRAGGTLQTGRHVRYRDETPLCNLFLSMLDRLEAPIDAFGDSTGRLDGLTA